MKIANLELGQIPRIAAPFRDNTPNTTIDQAIHFGLDLAELRIDEFTDTSVDRVQAELTRFQSIPTIATIRSQAEGGSWKGTEDERAALYAAAIPKASAIDIELSSTEIFDDVTSAAREANCTVIASFHDFETIPDRARLDDYLARAKANGADILKIAVTTNTTEDLRQFAIFVAAPRDIPLIAIAMGPVGALSRVFFPALGSVITFAHFGRPSAPGQIAYHEMATLIAQFYPEYRHQKADALNAMQPETQMEDT